MKKGAYFRNNPNTARKKEGQRVGGGPRDPAILGLAQSECSIVTVEGGGHRAEAQMPKDR